MSKQEYYRQKYHKENPKWTDSMNIYRNTIKDLVSNETKLLDIGCGHGDFLKQIHLSTRFSYGIDPDQEALDKNTFITNKKQGFVEDLPYQDNFFDVVVLAWVLEHLPDPKKAFSEIYRVLKPGGRVIFLTPNKLNYNVWIIRLIPEKFHEFFTTRLYARKENDTYPKQYRINSLKDYKNILSPIGFKKVELILNGDPSYISFNIILFRIAVVIEKFLDLRPFRFAKVHFIGIYQK